MSEIYNDLKDKLECVKVGKAATKNPDIVHEWMFRFTSPQSESHRLLSQGELDYLISCTEKKSQVFKEDVDTKDIGILTKEQAKAFISAITINKASIVQSSVNDPQYECENTRFPNIFFINLIFSDKRSEWETQIKRDQWIWTGQDSHRSWGP